jgi:response regulator NasT
VAEAGNATDALDAALRLDPDLVISELALADQDGISLATLLTERGIAPVVILAAEAQPEQVRRAAAAGVLAYLVKPFRIANVVSSIEVAHSQWQAESERLRNVRRLKEREETRVIVERAKRALMTSNGLTEKSAYRFIQTRSMSSRRPMRVVAESILGAHVRTDVRAEQSLTVYGGQ